MEIGIGLEIDTELSRLTSVVVGLEDRLKRCLGERQYGQDVSGVFIGLILIEPTGARLHPLRPIRYTKKSSFKSQITGQRTTIENIVTLDVRPPYRDLLGMSAAAAEIVISQSLASGVATLVDHQRKFPRFRAAEFVSDFVACLSTKTS